MVAHYNELVVEPPKRTIIPLSCFFYYSFHSLTHSLSPLLLFSSSSASSQLHEEEFRRSLQLSSTNNEKIIVFGDSHSRVWQYVGAKAGIPVDASSVSGASAYGVLNPNSISNSYGIYNKVLDELEASAIEARLEQEEEEEEEQQIENEKKKKKQRLILLMHLGSVDTAHVIWMLTATKLEKYRHSNSQTTATTISSNSDTTTGKLEAEEETSSKFEEKTSKSSTATDDDDEDAYATLLVEESLLEAVRRYFVFIDTILLPRWTNPNGIAASANDLILVSPLSPIIPDSVPCGSFEAGHQPYRCSISHARRARLTERMREEISKEAAKRSKGRDAPLKVLDLSPSLSLLSEEELWKGGHEGYDANGEEPGSEFCFDQHYRTIDVFTLYALKLKEVLLSSN
jgi:hypothetical protein